MSVSATSISRDQLLSRINEMRPLLLALANERLSRDIQSKIGASDIVQQTLMEAYQHAHTIQPEDDKHLFHWTMKILARNFLDVRKFYRSAKKRSVQRERRLPSSANLADKKQTASPMELHEELESLDRALLCLPQAHRLMLNWRFQQRLSFPEIAERVNRSENAVRMTVNRAIERLNREMKYHDHSSAS